MKKFAIYVFWGHYRSLECATEQDGLAILSDLATHDDIDPVCVYNPVTQKYTWHPQNPYKHLQEADPELTRCVLKSQASHWLALKANS